MSALEVRIPATVVVPLTATLRPGEDGSVICDLEAVLDEAVIELGEDA